MVVSKRGLWSWARLSLGVFNLVVVLAQSINRECDVSERIQCGTPAISHEECLVLNCCYDGQCFYGNSVYVQCTRDGHFLVVVAQDATVPQLDLGSVSLLGGSGAPCSPVKVSASFAIFYVPLNTCGTLMKEDSGYVVYENKLSSLFEVEVGPLGSVARDPVFEVLFQCWYWGSEAVSLGAELNMLEPPCAVVAPRLLQVELRLGRGQYVKNGAVEADQAYSSYYMPEDYPVHKVLWQPIYVEVRVLGGVDPNLVLLLEKCWETSSPDPLSLPQWTLLVDGCPSRNAKYLTTLVPVPCTSGITFVSHYKRFVTKMFTFVDPATKRPLREQMFIHCSAAVCAPPSGCELGCSRNRRDVAMVRNTPSRKRSGVSSGEIIITSNELPLSASVSDCPGTVPTVQGSHCRTVVASSGEIILTSQ